MGKDEAMALEKKSHVQVYSSSSSSSRLKILLHSIIALTIWTGPIYINTVLVSIAIFSLPSNQAFMIFGLLLLLAVIPLNENSKLGNKLSRYICKYVCEYFPVNLHVEDINKFDPNQSYVFGFEPHSVFPIGVFALFSHMPVSNIKLLASSAIFCTPFLGQIWTWVGLRPATKQNFTSLLRSGCSCIIVPGGIQEVFYMEQTCEVVFLKARKGFVRVAMESGRPLVPVFCFGQTNAYKWWKPSGNWYRTFSRALKFPPIFFWGVFGTHLPFRNPMHVVVGTPIELKKNPNPTLEEVENIQSQFVKSLEDLFEKHKARVGHAHLQLRIL